MTVTKPLGAQFEISIDGTPRTYRDLKRLAIEAAELLKRKPESAKLQSCFRTSILLQRLEPRQPLDQRGRAR
jgi:hypothetical protein